MFFSVRIETYWTRVSLLQLLAPVDYPLSDLLSHLVLKSYHQIQQCNIEVIDIRGSGWG